MKMSMIKEKTLYERIAAARAILDIGTEATVDEIKEAFRSRIRRCHPDKTGNSNDRQNAK